MGSGSRGEKRGRDADDKDQLMRYKAVQIAALLPHNSKDALLILEHAQTLVRFCSTSKAAAAVLRIVD